MKKLNLAALCALALVGLTAVGAGAQTNPYVNTGYDVSYPNCSTTPPTGDAFGIVGVNGGRPFTTNSCFGAEYSTAATGTGSVSMYINTAYSGAYKRNITGTCTSLVSGTGLTGSYAQAWEIGCSEADTSLGAVAGRSAVMWWLDVETGNSWSSSNLSLNQDAIRGAADRLKAAGAALVGVYSTASSWRTITGGSYTPPSTDAEWVAGGSCSTPFDANPVWLSQQGTSGGVDSDLAC